MTNKKAYTIEKLEDRPVFIITWGTSDRFSPTDEAFLAEMNEIIESLGEDVTLIMDTGRFMLRLGEIAERIIGAVDRPGLLPRHPLVHEIIVIVTNRFLYLLIIQLSQRVKSAKITLVQSLGEALEIVG